MWISKHQTMCSRTVLDIHSLSEHDLNILRLSNVHEMLQHVKFKWLKANSTNEVFVIFFYLAHPPQVSLLHFFLLVEHSSILLLNTITTNKCHFLDFLKLYLEIDYFKSILQVSITNSNYKNLYYSGTNKLTQESFVTPICKIDLLGCEVSPAHQNS